MADPTQTPEDPLAGDPDWEAALAEARAARASSSKEPAPSLRLVPTPEAVPTSAPAPAPTFVPSPEPVSEQPPEQPSVQDPEWEAALSEARAARGDLPLTGERAGTAAEAPGSGVLDPQAGFAVSPIGGPNLTPEQALEEYLVQEDQRTLALWEASGVLKAPSKAEGVVQLNQKLGIPMEWADKHWDDLKDSLAASQTDPRKWRDENYGTFLYLTENPDEPKTVLRNEPMSEALKLIRAYASGFQLVLTGAMAEKKGEALLSKHIQRKLRNGDLVGAFKLRLMRSQLEPTEAAQEDIKEGAETLEKYALAAGPKRLLEWVGVPEEVAASAPETVPIQVPVQLNAARGGGYAADLALRSWMTVEKSFYLFRQQSLRQDELNAERGGRGGWFKDAFPPKSAQEIAKARELRFENQARILRLEQEIGGTQYYGETPLGLWGAGKILGDVSEVAGSQIAALGSTGVGMAAGGGTTVALFTLGGGIIGLLSPVPGGLKAGAALGLKAGVAVAPIGMELGAISGAVLSTYTLERGGTYGDLYHKRDADGNPIDPQLAIDMSILGAAAKTGIEMGTLGLELDLLGFGGLLGGRQAGKVLTNVMLKPSRQRLLLNWFGSRGFKALKYALGEGGEEFFQENIDIGLGYATPAINAWNLRQPFDLGAEAARAGHSAWAGLIGAGFGGGASIVAHGAARTALHGYRKLRPSRPPSTPSAPGASPASSGPAPAGSAAAAAPTQAAPPLVVTATQIKIARSEQHAGHADAIIAYAEKATPGTNVKSAVKKAQAEIKADNAVGGEVVFVDPLALRDIAPQHMEQLLGPGWKDQVEAAASQRVEDAGGRATLQIPTASLVRAGQSKSPALAAMRSHVTTVPGMFTKNDLELHQREVAEMTSELGKNDQAIIDAHTKLRAAETKLERARKSKEPDADEIAELEKEVASQENALDELEGSVVEGEAVSPAEARFKQALHDQLVATGKQTDNEARQGTNFVHAFIRTIAKKMASPQAADEVFRGMTMAINSVSPTPSYVAQSSQKLYVLLKKMTAPQRAKVFWTKKDEGVYNGRGWLRAMTSDPRRFVAGVSFEGIKFKNSQLHSQGNLLYRLGARALKMAAEDAGRWGGDFVALVESKEQGVELQRAVQANLDALLREANPNLPDTITLQVVVRTAPRGDNLGAAADAAMQDNKEARDQMVREGTRADRTEQPLGIPVSAAELNLPDTPASERTLSPEMIADVARMTIADIFDGAMVDPMTGHLTADARELLPRKAFQLAVDLDGIKLINEHKDYGTKYGDEVIKGFAEAANFIGAARLAGTRLGGDEFVYESDDKGELYYFVDILAELVHHTNVRNTKSKKGIYFEVIDDQGRQRTVAGIAFGPGVGPTYDRADIRSNAYKERERESPGIGAERRNNRLDVQRRGDLEERPAYPFTRRIRTQAPIGIRKGPRESVRKVRHARAVQEKLAAAREAAFKEADPRKIAELLQNAKSAEAEAAAAIVQARLARPAKQAPFGTRKAALSTIAHESLPEGMDSSPSQQADDKYYRHRDGLGPKPGPFGNKDTFKAVDDYLGLRGKKRVSGLAEAFDLLVGNERTWKAANEAVEILRGVPGLENLRMPEDWLTKMGEEEVLKAQYVQQDLLEEIAAMQATREEGDIDFEKEILDEPDSNSIYTHPLPEDRQDQDFRLWDATAQELGVVDDPTKATFVLPDGRLTGGTHAQLVKAYKRADLESRGPDLLTDFILSGAVRLQYQQDPMVEPVDTTLYIHAGGPLSTQQKQALAKTVREVSRVMVDFQTISEDIVGEEFEGPASPAKVFEFFEQSAETLFQGDKERAREEIVTRTLTAKVRKNLTPDERALLNEHTAKRVVEIFEKLPSAKEFAAGALAGIAKRGWYKQSAEALITIFGADAPRFAALLGALSPNNPVPRNLEIGLVTWAAWLKAGRPTDEKAILKALGKAQTPLVAWENNVVRALSTEDVDQIVLSGPKADSFFQNLIGVTSAVTLDTWMANFALVDQGLFAGRMTVWGEPGKRPGYMAFSARVREAAAYLSELTGETWTPDEVQETVWAWSKALSEQLDLTSETRTAPELARDTKLMDELVAATPDFGSLIGLHATLLEEAGYGKQLEQLRKATARRATKTTKQESQAGSEAKAAAPAPSEKLLDRAARRIQESKLKSQTLDQPPAYVERLYHTSGEPISEIHDRGLFGSTLFFTSGGPYYMTESRKPIVYSIDIDPKHIIAVGSLLDAPPNSRVNEIVREIMELGSDAVDRETAEDLLTARQSVWDSQGDEPFALPDDVIADIDYRIQRLQVDAAVAQGFRGVEGEDEQGAVYAIDMKGRHGDLREMEEAKRGLGGTEWKYAETLDQPPGKETATTEEGPPRGSIQILRDHLALNFITWLRTHADLSSFLHESSHAFLEMLFEMAAHPSANDALQAQAQTALDWLGADSPNEVTRKQKEQWAAAFEDYVARGISPSTQLSAPMQSGKVWMEEIYKGVSRLGVPLDEKIITLFDGILATEAEIKRVQHAAGMANPLWEMMFDENLSPKEKAERLEERAEAAVHATKVAQRLLAEGQARALKAWKTDTFRKMQKRAEEEWADRPDVQAWDLVRYGRVVNPDGTVVQNAALGKMTKARFTALWGEKTPLEQKLGKRLVDNGTDPVAIAGQTGYDTARDMFEAMENLPNEKEWIRARAEELTLEARPSIVGELADLEGKIADVLVGDSQKVLLAELKAINKRSPRQLHVIREATERAAEINVANTVISNLNAERALAQMQKSGDKTTEAGIRKDKAAMETHKVNQILHAATHKETRRAIVEATRFGKLLKLVAKRPIREKMARGEPLTVDGTDQILEVLNVLKVDPDQAEREGLEVIASKLELDFDGKAVVGILKNLVEQAADPAKIRWSSLTVREMRIINTALRQLYVRGRAGYSIIDHGERRDLDTIVGEIDEEMEYRPDEYGIHDLHTTIGRMLQWGQGYKAARLQPRTLFQLMGKTGFRILQTAFDEAALKRRDLLLKVGDHFADNWRDLPKNIRKTRYDLVEGTEEGGPVAWPEDIPKYLLPRADHLFMLMVAHNMGNESNAERLLGGYKWNEAQVWQWLEDNMSEQEWDFVEGTWSLNDDVLWPEAARTYKEDKGLAPPKIRARSHTLRSGRVIHGGYVPARYHPVASRYGAEQNVEALEGKYAASAAKMSISKTFTKERAAHYKDIILLDWNVVPQHVLGVVHYVAFDRYHRQAKALISHPRFRNLVQSRMGPAYYNALTDEKIGFLMRVANPRIDQAPRGLQSLADMWVKWPRQALTAQALGGRLLLAANAVVEPAATSLMRGGPAPLHSALNMARFWAGGPLSVGQQNSAMRGRAMKINAVRERWENLGQGIRAEMYDVTRGGRPLTVREWIYDKATFVFFDVFDHISAIVIGNAALDEAQARQAAGLPVRGKLEYLDENITPEDYASEIVRNSLVPQERMIQSMATANKRGMAILMVMQSWFEQQHNMAVRTMDPKLVAFSQAVGLIDKTTASVGVLAAGTAVWASLAISNTFGELLAGHGKEPDEDDITYLVRKIIAARFLTLGPVLNAAAEEIVINQIISGKRRFYSSRNIPAEIVDSLHRAGEKALSGDAEDFDSLMALLTAIGAISRTPLGGTQMKRTTGYLRDAAEGMADTSVLGAASGILEGEREDQPENLFSFIQRWGEGDFPQID